MALDATPAGSSSNSYGTAVEADDYFANRRLNGEGWAALTTATKERALVMACNLLERGFEWQGALRIWSQKLSWPRSGVEITDGRYEPYDTVPDGVKEAQFELAFALTKKDRLAAQEPELVGLGFSHVKAGDVEIDVDDATIPIVPDVVIALLERYGTPKETMLGSKGMKQIKLVR
jgi:hypothetical protein